MRPTIPKIFVAKVISDRRNIWFTVDGDNSFKQLDVVRTDGTYPGIQAFVFSGECGQLDCMGSGPFFYAEAGKKYYINLGGGAFYGELQITLQCSDGAENDLCHDALPITCGQLVTGTFNRVKPCDYADPCQDFLDYKRVWYQFTGNGSLINLKLTTTAYNSHLVRVAVFSGGCCNPEEIRYSYIGDSDFNGSAHKDVYFLSEEGAHIFNCCRAIFYHRRRCQFRSVTYIVWIWIIFISVKMRLIWRAESKLKLKWVIILLDLSIIRFLVW